MKKIFLILPYLFAHFLAAQTPTWSNPVAAIIYQNCTACHRTGGIAPFTLNSYNDAVVQASAIQTSVVAKNMPPWMPSPDYCHYVGEKILSQTEITAISDWVANGTPSGDLSQAPQSPTFSGASQLLQIDQSVQMPTYTIQSNQDEHRVFVMHSNYSTDTYLSEIEFMPGNLETVHHIVLYQDSTNATWLLDQNDPLAGFNGAGTNAVGESVKLIYGWLPGGGVAKFPLDMGFRIPAGADFVMEIHYAPGNIGKIDSTQINLRFATVSQPRQVYFETFYPTMTNPPLFIAANMVDTFYQVVPNIAQDISMLSIYPHAHLIGKAFKVYAVTPTNDTIPLVYVPNWNFHWQGNYTFLQPIKIPAGSSIYEEAIYDNTSNNPNNPHSPPQDVYAGATTEDEMMVCVFAYLYYQAGDENINLGETTNIFLPQNQGFIVYPNPSEDIIYIKNDLSIFQTIEIININGQVLLKKELSPKNNHFSIKELPSGVYFLKLGNKIERFEKK